MDRMTRGDGVSLVWTNVTVSLLLNNVCVCVGDGAPVAAAS